MSELFAISNKFQWNAQINFWDNTDIHYIQLRQDRNVSHTRHNVIIIKCAPIKPNLHYFLATLHYITMIPNKCYL
jgi:hypothetical protein